MIFSDIPISVRITFSAIAVLLVIASLFSRWLQVSRPDKNYHELRQRIQTWWVIVAVFAVGVLFNKTTSVITFGLIINTHPSRRP